MNSERLEQPHRLQTAPSRRDATVGVGFALAAALSYAAAQVITRQAVSDVAPPLVGTFLALLWGTVGFSLLSARGLTKRPKYFWRGARFFALGGIFSAIGVSLLFQALSRGEIVVVAPVVATNPLFTMLLAALLLRGVEQITRRVVTGTLLVVIGVIVLTVA